MTKKILLLFQFFLKKGERDGDVRFSRAKNDIYKFASHNYSDLVTTFFDYYGVTEWPGTKAIPENSSSLQIANIVNSAIVQNLKKEFPQVNFDDRFVPYVAMHEFEALLFSDSLILSSKINVEKEIIDTILQESKEPEAINNSHLTSPSKRLATLTRKRFKKTVTGIDIAREIGIDKMRKKCPIFNAWLEKIESLQKN